MSTCPTRYELQDSIAVVVLDSPPVNALGLALRTGILDAFDRAMRDPAVTAVVIAGSGRAFSAGADVNEFGTARSTTEPRLATLIEAIEDAPKPVVAAVAGICMGGGLELALAAHFRVARRGARLAMPEVKLGLLPGAGGTQRLPRLVGLEAAVNFIVGGATAPAGEFADTRLFDELTDDDVIAAAVAFAGRVVSERLPLRRVRDLKVDDPYGEPYLQFARNSVAASSKGYPAPLKCVEAVGWSFSKPFDEALQLERAAFLALMASPESRALRHVRAAEHQAAKIDDVPPGTATRGIQQVGVVGAGTMGRGIAISFLNAGFRVAIVETDEQALDNGLKAIRAIYEQADKKGKITAVQAAERMARLVPGLHYGALADADLVVEAVYENMDVKAQVFRALDEVCKPGAILASNTSYMDIDRIATNTARVQDVIGLHFFSPANVMRLVEVVRGKHTAIDVLATCMALARALGKVAVVSGVCDGFIGNRMLARYRAAADELVIAGAMPQQIDAALQDFGFSMGPFRMSDLAGLDIGWATRKRRAAEAGVEMQRTVADKLCEAGRYGQKAGAGWYRYEPGKREPLRDPAVEEIVRQHRAEKQAVPREISNREVVERCVYALVNEGARILEEGIAARASDIDTVYLNGYGFSARRGGPMHYADVTGLPLIVRSLRRFAAEPGADPCWQPAALLSRLADQGKSFT
ncbi:3-hydroxyacyl-CoA dehydrogenase NAD-binding domain-containing protein [Bordetella genomosp. 6]|uniref:3-hydroxyacyl-CoA dehydrogenase NAD-binding domain-containing protein n=1 Tax=Bordetella genomosp. 6 TaxID=463024 RepID=UPI000A290E1A|nr:3-hydroxyacyl-CoA dehydrogenase NAD-binding domain-containing protein [Bordetella genomosp. 6]ARP77705.1 3-hydroxyacyl-CoA dehydrogenase [Bordetella genomosp. 6]